MCLFILSSGHIASVNAIVNPVEEELIITAEYPLNPNVLREISIDLGDNENIRFQIILRHFRIHQEL